MIFFQQQTIYKAFIIHNNFLIIINKHIHGFAIFQPNNVHIIVPLTLKRKY